jgi:hypothetical protein
MIVDLGWTKKKWLKRIWFWFLPGANVIVTIFGDFRQFSAGKMTIFLEKQCHVSHFAQTISILSKTRLSFIQFFRRRYFLK